MNSIIKYFFVLAAIVLLSCNDQGLKSNLELLQKIDSDLNLIINKAYALNDMQYNIMEMALLNNPVKMQKDYDKSKELLKTRASIIKLVDNLKTAALFEIHGEDTAQKDLSENISIVDYSSFEKSIYDLKHEMDSYVAFCQNSIEEQNAFLRDTFLFYLRVNPKEETTSWAKENFNDKPLIVFLASLDNIKLQIIQCEYLLLRYLYTKNEERKSKFVFSAVVLAESNYIKLGQQYKAEIFMAGVDTNATGMLLIGKVDMSTFQIVGKADTIKIEKGIGKYIVPTSQPGNYKYSGIFSVKISFGSNKNFPFVGEYTVVKN